MLALPIVPVYHPFKLSRVWKVLLVSFQRTWHIPTSTLLPHRVKQQNRDGIFQFAASISLPSLKAEVANWWSLGERMFCMTWQRFYQFSIVCRNLTLRWSYLKFQTSDFPWRMERPENAGFTTIGRTGLVAWSPGCLLWVGSGVARAAVPVSSVSSCSPGSLSHIFPICVAPVGLSEFVTLL